MLACVGGAGYVYLRGHDADGDVGLSAHRIVKPSARLQQAVANLERARNFEFDVETHALGPNGEQWLNGGGHVDLVRKRVEEAMTPGPKGSTTDEYYRAFEDHSRGAAVVYFRASFTDGRLPAGKTWVKVDMSKKAWRLQPDDVGNPIAMLALLHRARAPQLSGTETIGGVAAARYVVSIDTARAPTPAGAYLDRIDVRGLPITQANLWIDVQQNIRRVQVTMQRPNENWVVTQNFVAIDAPGDSTINLPAPQYVIDADAIPGLSG